MAADAMAGLRRQVRDEPVLVGGGMTGHELATRMLLADWEPPRPILMAGLDGNLTEDRSATRTVMTVTRPVGHDDRLIHHHAWKQRPGWRRERCACGAERRHHGP